MTHEPLARDARGRRASFFSQDGVDQLVTMVLELATEIWVLRERLFTLEAVAGKAGLGLTEGIESFSATPSQAAQLERMRAAMLDQLFRTLQAEPAARPPSPSNS